MAEAAHIDHQIESDAAQLADALGEMVAQVEVLFGHGEDGLRRHTRIAGLRPALAATRTSPP